MPRRVIPIERLTGLDQDLMARAAPPVRWYALIKQVEAFSQSTGMGLANVWGLINRSEYDHAVALFEEIRERHRQQSGVRA